MVGLILNSVCVYALPGLSINEVSFGEWNFTSGDGIYGVGWIELRNNTDSIIGVHDLYLSTDKDPAWQLPAVYITPGSHYFIWLSGKDTVTEMGVPHASFSLSDSTKYIKLFDATENLTLDSVAIYAPPVWNGTYGRCQDGSDEWCYFTSTTPGSANLSLGLWQNIATKTQFYPRDSSPNAALYFKSKHWILEGWKGGGGESASFSNSWSSVDGLYWTLENDAPPYDPYSAYVVFKDKMWAFSDTSYSSTDGIIWTKIGEGLPFGRHARVVEFKEQLYIIKGTSIWKSDDGIAWGVITHEAPWPAREFPGLLAFNEKLWLFGGGINYNTGDDQYFNDVWVSDDGLNWSRVAEHVEWEGRYWFGFATFDNKMWMLGGWNYHNNGDYSYGNKNDVWYSENGTAWQQLRSSNTWRPRHAPFVWVDETSLWVSSGYLNNGGLMNDVWRIEKFENLSPDNYYLKSGGPVELLSSWGTNPDGSGITPKDFNMDFQTFIICNSDSIQLDTTWQVAGLNSSVIIGNEAPIYFEVKDGIELMATIALQNNAVFSVGNGVSASIISAHENSEMIIRQGSGIFPLDAASVGRLIVESDSLKLLHPTVIKQGVVFNGHTILGNGQFQYDSNTFLNFQGRDFSLNPDVLWPKDNSPSTIIIDLNGTVSVSGNVLIDSLALVNGKLEISEGILTVNNISGGNESSYIVTGDGGAVEIMEHENLFYFPIGTASSYNPLMVTPQGESGLYLAASVFEVDTLQFENYSVNIMWKIHVPQSSAAQYHVEVYWESSNVGKFANEEYFVLATSTGEQWVESMNSVATFALDETHSISGFVNGDGLISVQDIRTKDNNIPLKVFPNPTAGPMNIFFKNKISSAGDIVLYDMTGRQKIHTEIENGTKSLQLNTLSTLEPASYILRITLDGKTYIRHVIIF